MRAAMYLNLFFGSSRIRTIADTERFNLVETQRVLRLQPKEDKRRDRREREEATETTLPLVTFPKDGGRGGRESGEGCFVVSRTPIVQRGVTTLAVVEHFQVLEQGHARLLACGVG